MQEESGRSRKVTREAWLQHPTMEIYQIKKRAHRPHIKHRKKQRSDKKDSKESH